MKKKVVISKLPMVLKKENGSSNFREILSWIFTVISKSILSNTSLETKYEYMKNATKNKTPMNAKRILLLM